MEMPRHAPYLKKENNDKKEEGVLLIMDGSGTLCRVSFDNTSTGN